MQFIRIREWEKYQHYKDRSPPWIKLHRGVLSSRTWVSCTDAEKALAIACMLLAALNDNRIPADPAYIKRVCYLDSEPNLQKLADLQFIEFIDEHGNPLADASTALAIGTKRTSETEGEERRGERESAPRSASEQRPARASKGSRKKAVTSMPEGFGISERVRAWAAEKGHSDLDRHLESFQMKVEAKGYQYADWDAALMNAIREDWAGLKKPRVSGVTPFPRNDPPTNPLRDTSKDYSGVKASTPEKAHAVVSEAMSRLKGSATS